MLVKTKRPTLSGLVLDLIGLAVSVPLSALASGVLQVMKVNSKDRWRRQRKYYINQVVARLTKRGLVQVRTNQTGRAHLRLTEKGKKEWRRYELKQLTIRRPPYWDGRYHVVIFDIKEWKRQARDEVRGCLEQLGFIRLQNSVWVYPYECAEAITLLKTNFHLGREVLYLTVESIENDTWLKRKFGLV